jgi:L-iditol 2-dehydrogenase
VAVLGSGPIGLLITHLARMSGADPVYAFDCHSWRAEKAVAWGASDAWTLDEMDPVKRIETVTNGKGVDVVFEAAWADESVTQAAQMADLGGRLVLVGIASDDRLTMPHSAARRKGLTIMMARRMKHTYARAIHMAESGSVDLDDMVSHRYPLSESPAAFAKNFAYERGVQKIVIEI